MSETVEKFDGGWAIEVRPGDVAVYLVRGDTEISARPNCGTMDIENDDAGFFTYPPRAAIESLLRRAALAPEAQAPSGEPWRPAVGRPGLARLLEWARGAEREADSSARDASDRRDGPHHDGRMDAYADCVREIEREIAALGPPSIAEDLRTPEPGAFEGAELVGEARVVVRRATRGMES